MMRMSTRGRHVRPDEHSWNVRGPLLVIAVALGDFLFAGAATTSLSITMALVAAVALGAACVAWPVIVMVAAFPASFGIWRVGPGSLGMSIADVIAFVGAAVALPHVPWHSRAFRRVLIAAAVYAAVVAVAAVAHFSNSGVVEVAHRFVMVMGATCIGMAVVRTGKVAVALRLLLAMALVIAVMAVLYTLEHRLKPAYVWGMQKNASGSLLATSIIVVFLAGRHFKLPRTVLMPAGLVLLCGLAATQSRGAATGLGAVIVVYAVRQVWRGEGRRILRAAPLVLLFAGALTFAMVQSFQSESKSHQGANYKYGSVGSREVTYNIAWNVIIKPHPLLGIGPKWFNNPNAPGTEPHNIVIDELASDGIIGLLALGFLLWTCFHVLRETPSALATAAWYVLLARLVADLFDIFWVAGPNTLPWLIFGLGLGAVSVAEDRVRSQKVAMQSGVSASMVSV